MASEKRNEGMWRRRAGILKINKIIQVTPYISNINNIRLSTILNKYTYIASNITIYIFF